jgi:hypothetical protein
MTSADWLSRHGLAALKLTPYHVRIDRSLNCEPCAILLARSPFSFVPPFPLHIQALADVAFHSYIPGALIGEHFKSTATVNTWGASVPSPSLLLCRRTVLPPLTLDVIHLNRRWSGATAPFELFTSIPSRL